MHENFFIDWGELRSVVHGASFDVEYELIPVLTPYLHREMDREVVEYLRPYADLWDPRLIEKVSHSLMSKWLQGHWVDLLRLTSVSEDLCTRLENGCFGVLLTELLELFENRTVDRFGFSWSVERWDCVRDAYSWLLGKCSDVDADGGLTEPVIEGGELEHILSYHTELESRYPEVYEDAFELDLVFRRFQVVEGWPDISRLDGGLTSSLLFFYAEFSTASSLLPFLELILQVNRRVQGAVFCGLRARASEAEKVWLRIAQFYAELRGVSI